MGGSSSLLPAPMAKSFMKEMRERFGAAIKQAKCALEQNHLALEQLKITAAQLEVSRTDIILRSKREAISVALEQCKRFAETILPRFIEINRELGPNGFARPKAVDPDFPLIFDEADTFGSEVWTKTPELRMKIIQGLNELESFAMYFASDLADESVAFVPTGLSFCEVCEVCRYFIGRHRPPEYVRLYQNLVKLYGIWKPRIERTLLNEQSKLLESKMQRLPPDIKGSPLGTKL
jgi:hypothetical protein